MFAVRSTLFFRDHRIASYSASCLIGRHPDQHFCERSLDVTPSCHLEQ